MSSGEENYFENSQEIEDYNPENEEVSHVENNLQLDDISPRSDVTFDANDTQNLEHPSSSDDHGDKITTEELPHSGNTESFKSQFESEPIVEERRTERRRERRRRRKLTEEEDGPSEGAAKSTVNKFEKGELDDMHFQKTDTSHDSMAQSGTVMSTTEKFRSGKYHSESDEENKKPAKEDDLGTVESGTAAARRKALEDYAEEAKKNHPNSPNVLKEDAPVLKPGKAANTRAKLERMSSEERILEKEVDVNTPKSGTASERRAKFEEKARQASVEEAPRQTARTARRSKWPEPNTNYRQPKGELRKSVSTDEEGGVSVERENAKNIEKSKDHADGHAVNEDDANTSSTAEISSDEAPKSPVKTADIRKKLVKMLSSEDERSASPPADLGNARPTAGTARNLRARFETNKQTEESHFHSKKASIISRSGYASRVRERFESGEVSRRRSSVTEEDGSAGITDPETRRRRTSSTRSVEAETSMMSRSAKELRNRFENPTQNTQVVKRNFVLRPKTGTASITAKFNKTAPATSKCTGCTKTVYPMEMITADDKAFHRKCFKCTECKATLRLGNYAALQGQIYCKPHFKQLFKVKGNYDEGFGRQQHKKHWEEKAKTENSSEDQKPEENNEVDSNANIKVPDNDVPHENGYDHPPAEESNGYDHPPDEESNGYDHPPDEETNGYDHPPDEQINGYDSANEDAFIGDDGIAT